MSRGKRKDRRSAMAKHRKGVQELASELLAAGYQQVDYDNHDGETLQPFSFMVSERYKLNGRSGILRDIVLRTDGPVVDVKLYHYAEAASHTSILRAIAYMLIHSIRKPDGHYLNLVPHMNALFDAVTEAQGILPDMRGPTGLRIAADTISQLADYRRKRQRRTR